MSAIRDIKGMNDAIAADTAGIDAPDEKGYVPLMYALNADFLDGIALLLGNGAAFTFDDVEGKKSMTKFIKSEKALRVLLGELDRRTLADVPEEPA